MIELGDFDKFTSSIGLDIPERCETCKWFKEYPHMVNGRERDGICKRFPSWESVYTDHKCGEWKEDD